MLNGTIFNDLGWLLTQNSRWRQYSTLNISETVQDRDIVTIPFMKALRTRASSTGDSLIRRSQPHWLDVVDRVRFRASLRPGVQMYAHDGCLPTAKLPTPLRHLWPSPPAIGWPWSSQFPMCEICFVRRTFICIRRPFELELIPAYLRDSSLSLSSFKHHLKTFLFSFYTQRVWGSFTKKTRYINSLLLLFGL